MPFGVPQRGEYMFPCPGIVYGDHRHHRGAPEKIKGRKSLTFHPLKLSTSRQIPASVE